MPRFDYTGRTLYDITGIESDEDVFLVSAEDFFATRRLLCLSYSKLPYLDDGELQDCEKHPCIDFLRDTPESIYAKMVGRMSREYPPSKHDTFTHRAV